ncbi:MAG: tetratricopeptide repeat protein [Balneolaceae bacterium]
MNIRKEIHTAIILLSVLILYQQPVQAVVELNTGSYEDQLIRGIDAFYRTDWRDAQKYFDELKSEYPDDPRAYFFESMIPFWKYFFVEQKVDFAKQFMSLSERAVLKSEKYLKQVPDDTTTVMILSGLYGYRSLVAAGEKEYRQAISSAINGFSYTRKLLALNESRPDARVGRGMFYYMTGNIPRELRWMTNAIGIRGNTAMGLEELEKASQSDSYIRFEAKMILAYLYNREGKFEKSLHYLDLLLEDYPTNSIFHFFRAEVLERLEEHGKAHIAYITVLKLDNSHFETLIEISKERINKLTGIGYLKNSH